VDVVARVLAPARVVGLQQYLEGGGGRGLAASRQRASDAVIGDIEASGLRGRGGAGFPTGRKWRTVVAYESGEMELPSVVVNAAEGEPGSFKDREILGRNPYRVLEGALIAAHAVGAGEVIVALKRSFAGVAERVREAIEEVRAVGWLDGVDIGVFEGPGEYLYGEETGLLEAIDGRPPFPRIAPPYRRGVEEIVERPADVDTGSASAAQVEMAGPTDESVGPPTLVNNVETMANVPGIMVEGPEWFRSLGTEESPGTLVCTVTGATQRHGVREVPMGTPLAEMIEVIGGGPKPGRTITAVMGGVSNPLLTAAQLDTPLSHEAMQQIGTGLGCGAFIVFDDRTDLAAVAEGVARFLSVESCGQCTPCKRDGLALADLFGRVRRSEADDDDLAAIDDRLRTVTDSARCNLAYQYLQVLQSILDGFGDELRGHVDGAMDAAESELIAPIVELDGPHAVLDDHQCEKQPDWTYDAPWSGKSPAERLGNHRHDEEAE
jgi:NADH-quinone oxidoreductase subunit F